MPYFFLLVVVLFDCLINSRRPSGGKSDLANPNGIESSSPGLRGTSYPGLGVINPNNPNGVASRLGDERPQPRWGWKKSGRRSPKVARASQPWALGRNPFGIHLPARSNLRLPFCPAGTNDN